MPPEVATVGVTAAILRGKCARHQPTVDSRTVLAPPHRRSRVSPRTACSQLPFLSASGATVGAGQDRWGTGYNGHMVNECRPDRGACNTSTPGHMRPCTL